ncbi:MAG: hypothetical protein ABEJ47_02150 [Halorhabdus sp.]
MEVLVDVVEVNDGSESFSLVVSFRWEVIPKRVVRGNDRKLVLFDRQICDRGWCPLEQRFPPVSIAVGACQGLPGSADLRAGKPARYCTADRRL